ncbi:MAG: iron export ABC transporter permease subunit FetB [Aerococcus sp.]|nr:iron export ABC transporter permease subunit FetB [Aerococcus sp.]
MAYNMTINIWSLLATFSLVIISLIISWKEDLGLIKDILIAIFRMSIQLTIVGYILIFVFQIDNWLLTTVMVGIMDINAAWTAQQRGKGIKHHFAIANLSVFGSSIVSMFILVITGAILYVPNQVIPMNGMLIGVAMNITGLSFTNLAQTIDNQRQQINEKLALGASTKQASKNVIRDAVRNSLQPQIDTTKTVGLVILPGLMTGILFGGNFPKEAIMYQILFYFAMMAVATISSVITVYLSYPSYYSEFGQLLPRPNAE